MRTLFFTLAVAGVFALSACKQSAPEEQMTPAEAPDYAAFDAKVAIIEAFYKAHEAENLETLANLLSDTLQWSPPQYNGNQWLGKDDLLAALKGYHENFDDIRFTPGVITANNTAGAYWSGSVFPESTATTLSTNIRVYGTWNATHTETGKPTGVKFYSLITVNDAGKIASASDYFDVNGLAVQIAAE
ncbi:SnoaL-like domain-containing protein [Muriicola jejuensis]|uniref:Nuclear transport factor 2 family protein n=1 Tax=Muriicola jejuensis TaxID=504488 RepID=A0A6P0UFA6_9FLAO|nr:nuclear transport factor 2 family protein [Muriicola jejuensis]NER11697.1 nuclear transport factor 2 family protein [Muriicola jejuensis]SMP25414.1 SnoaL-like domain-containing protein [Muriicola jejuensis]